MSRKTKGSKLDKFRRLAAIAEHNRLYELERNKQLVEKAFQIKYTDTDTKQVS